MNSWKTAFGSYLKSEDLQGKPVLVTIASVGLEEVRSDNDKNERKLIAHFVGKDKAMILNRTNAEAIAQIAGTDDIDEWPGVRVVLYVDTNVQFQGRKVSGLRIKGPARLVTSTPKPPPFVAPAPVEEFDNTPVEDDDDVPF